MDNPSAHVKYLHVSYACGHSADIKTAPTISAAFIREIRNEAKHEPCSACAKLAGKKASLGLRR